jgi:Putative transmembrane family 234
MAVYACLVGVIWGSTDAVARLGVLKAGNRRKSASGWAATHWGCLLSNPTYALAQALNWGGSALFVMLLRGSRLHVVAPVANAVSLASNVGCSVLVLRERWDLRLLLPGLLCVVIGAYLSAT